MSNTTVNNISVSISWRDIDKFSVYRGGILISFLLKWIYFVSTLHMIVNNFVIWMAFVLGIPKFLYSVFFLLLQFQLLRSRVPHYKFPVDHHHTLRIRLPCKDDMRGIRNRNYIVQYYHFVNMQENQLCCMVTVIFQRLWCLSDKTKQCKRKRICLSP